MSNLLDKVGDFKKWFEGKVKAQEQLQTVQLSKVDARVDIDNPEERQLEEQQECFLRTIKIKGKAVGQMASKSNTVWNTIRIEACSTSDYEIQSAEIRLISNTKNALPINSEVEIQLSW